MGSGRYYYLHLDEETKIRRGEGIIIVSICGTLMCREISFPWGCCASLAFGLIRALRLG